MDKLDVLDGLLSEITHSKSDINFSKPSLLVSETSDMPATKGRLCLNMIVKNESRIIERLLASVLSIVDAYCICDTGSTDDTADLIRKFMLAAGKPGEVYTEPFKNFGYNRTHALERASKWGTYALLLDADMKLVIEPDFKVAELTDDGYTIIQRSGGMEYYNVRIVRTGVGVKCVGPTHEYYDFPHGLKQTQIKTIWINDIGDGGAKSDKFERDVRLLLKGIEDDPKNDRYHFYLANSYRDLGKHREAIEYYKKRTELGGWIEEVFYAYYELGNMYKTVGEMGNAVYYWLEAYNYHPKRAESLFEIVKHYREVGKQHIGMMFCKTALAIPFPKHDVLFIKTTIYEYLLEYEYSVLAHYTGSPIDHYKYLELIGHQFAKDNVFNNYRCYVKKLKNMKGVRDVVFDEKLDKHIGGRDDTFTSSSPCIVAVGDEYLLNVRFVNYIIRGDGSYQFRHEDGKITTLNKQVWLNKNLEVKSQHWFDKVQDEGLRYQGVEDVKVFNYRGAYHFLGTVQQTAGPGHITVGRGIYDMESDTLISKPCVSPAGRDCEKNWCYATDDAGDLKVVYEWSPLTIAEIDGNTLKIVEKYKDVPPFFRDVRGSSNGCRVGDELWFLCHIVQYSMPRHYYHIFVVLEGASLKYKRHSIPFKFHGESIEYALGLVVEPDRVLISYSKMDRTSAVMVLPRDIIGAELFPAPFARF